VYPETGVLTTTKRLPAGRQLFLVFISSNSPSNSSTVAAAETNKISVEVLVVVEDNAGDYAKLSAPPPPTTTTNTTATTPQQQATPTLRLFRWRAPTNDTNETTFVDATKARQSANK
jgi:hypothetical protein